MPPTAPGDARRDTATLAGADELLAHIDRIEAQLREVRDGLAHSHRLATLGTIASIVAHEYNNILTPIISYAQLALATPEDQELLVKAVQKALQGAERAATISASILGFAAEQGGGCAADLQQTIRDALGCMARPPEKDGVTMEIRVPEVWVAMGAVPLQQVLVNLMLNARKAMRGRGGILRLIGTTESGVLRLTVADTGPGIPPEILGRLFEPFVTHPSGSGGARGTGLGLSICRDLLRQAGGTITAESRVGQGASFHLEIPLAPPMPDDA